MHFLRVSQRRSNCYKNFCFPPMVKENSKQQMKRGSEVTINREMTSVWQSEIEQQQTPVMSNPKDQNTQ